jgi:CubicO group peptidase (beta-lactamase class C family)
MKSRRRVGDLSFLAALTTTLLASAPVSAQQTTTTRAVDPAAVDAIFARFNGTDRPGCAVGVSREGRPVLAAAYGMADLEHDVTNRAETVFESGSVSKQFTAAATILLALDGKLSLNDDIRKYIPELPEYDDIVTIRHLLNHTSGLRDWGSIAGIEGWPRTTRVHTHEHVLDIMGRQRSLNYRPGEYYSYTNTGYNLQAVLVERVSGMSFAEFSRVRLFDPLGLTRTQWRDDFTRVVHDRAVAYSPAGTGQEVGWRTNMPFENVHGNGGLLTTVADLLRFSQNLETGAVGGPAFLEEMHRQAILNSGRQIAYASGLSVGEYRGRREVQHSGGTAGYRAFSTRFPDQKVAVAVLCNVASANATQFAHRVADLYLGDAVNVDVVAEPTIELSSEAIAVRAGAYRNTRTQALVQVTAVSEGLRLRNAVLLAVSESRFAAGSGVSLDFQDSSGGDGRAAADLMTPDGDVVRLEPVPEFRPTSTELAAYVGTYRSDEAEATYTVELDGLGLLVKDRYARVRTLAPSYPDVFSGPLGLYIFRRDDAGAVVSFSLSQGRVWDLRFRRVE